jgi:hypothetical protein
VTRLLAGVLPFAVLAVIGCVPLVLLLRGLRAQRP